MPVRPAHTQKAVCGVFTDSGGYLIAKDAQDRRKDQDMIGWFLSYAQDSAYEFCSLQPDEDVYVVLDSLLPTTVTFGTSVGTNTRLHFYR
jgi:hypothetical protein